MKNAIIVIAVVLVLFLLTSYMESMYTTMEIYTADVDTFERGTAAEIRVKSDASVAERLEAITQGLSTHVFKLPMEFLGIDLVFNQKVARVNLMENPKNPDLYPWNTGYFQGSTGGAITSISLIDSYLQPTYEEEWIDGVKFLYEGETIEFEHVYGLQQTQYRIHDYKLNDLSVNDELLEGLFLKYKMISDDGLEVAYELDGPFQAIARFHYFEYEDAYRVMLLDSPLRAVNIEVDFAEDKMPYTESFNWMFDLSNPEYFRVALKAYDETLYDAFKDGDPVELPVLLSSFTSWLFAESEYTNSVKFVEILEEMP